MMIVVLSGSVQPAQRPVLAWLILQRSITAVPDTTRSATVSAIWPDNLCDCCFNTQRHVQWWCSPNKVSKQHKAHLFWNTWLLSNLYWHKHDSEMHLWQPNRCKQVGGKMYAGICVLQRVMFCDFALQAIILCSRHKQCLAGCHTEHQHSLFWHAVSAAINVMRCPYMYIHLDIIGHHYTDNQWCPGNCNWCYWSVYNVHSWVKLTEHMLLASQQVNSVLGAAYMHHEWRPLHNSASSNRRRFRCINSPLSAGR